MAITLLKGASKLHEEMLRSVMKSPMAFFDSTPAGRVINRFSKDMDESKRNFSSLFFLVYYILSAVCLHYSFSGCQNALLHRICCTSYVFMFISTVCGLFGISFIHSGGYSPTSHFCTL